MDTNYPSNSHKSKKKDKEIQKVVSGEVKTKKTSELKKIASIFVPEDVDDVKTYILTEQIIPTARDLIFDILKTMIYGGDLRDYRRGTSARTSYERYYDNRTSRKAGTSRNRNSYDYDDIIFPSRGEAEDVLENMDDLMERYHNVSIADFYELAGLDCPHTYNKYGWDDDNNLRNAKIVRYGDGYMIKLPKARPID